MSGSCHEWILYANTTRRGIDVGRKMWCAMKLLSPAWAVPRYRERLHAVQLVVTCAIGIGRARELISSCERSSGFQELLRIPISFWSCVKRFRTKSRDWYIGAFFGIIDSYDVNVLYLPKRTYIKCNVCGIQMLRLYQMHPRNEASAGKQSDTCQWEKFKPLLSLSTHNFLNNLTRSTRFTCKAYQTLFLDSFGYLAD